jgi:hypothetical protein
VWRKTCRRTIAAIVIAIGTLPRAGGAQGSRSVFDEPLTILDHFLVQARAAVHDAGIWPDSPDTVFWAFPASQRAPDVDPVAYVDPSSARIVVGLSIVVDRIKVDRRELCQSLIGIVERQFGAGDLARERPDLRNNVHSHLMPPSFFTRVPQRQRSAAYDELQTRMLLRVSDHESEPRQSLICERAALGDSLSVAIEHL